VTPLTPDTRPTETRIADAMALGTVRGAIRTLSAEAYWQLKEWLVAHEAERPELRRRGPEQGFGS
jgi:hypothetical protein